LGGKEEKADKVDPKADIVFTPRLTRCHSERSEHTNKAERTYNEKILLEQAENSLPKRDDKV